MELAQSRQIEREEFRQRVERITLAMLLLALLRGSGMSLDEFMASSDAMRAMREQEAIARQAVDRLSSDIYNNQAGFAPDLPEPEIVGRITNRVALWVSTLSALFALGQALSPDDPFLEWVVGPTEHCSDCLRLNGQVHRASEWLQSRWIPQSRRLECSGYRCQCSFFEAEGPAEGSF